MMDVLAKYICASLLPLWLIYYLTSKRKKYDVRDKVVLVTGASSGLGEACAVLFYKHGAKVILCSRRNSELERVKKKLLDIRVPNSHEPKVICLDLEKLEDITSTVSDAVRAHGRIDVLINNAGISYRGVAMETNINVDIKVMNVNYFGQIAVTKAVLPVMASQGNGHIVTVSSLQGRIAIPYRSAYAASKHALQAFFDSLRAEVADMNIRVSVISPGYIQTNLSLNAVTEQGSQHGVMDRNTATGMTPDYVAQQILGMIQTEQNELVLCKCLHRLALWLRILWPWCYMTIMKSRAAKEKKSG